MSLNYQAIYDLINTASQELTYPVDFNWGEASDIDEYHADETKTILWLMPLIWTGSFPNDLNRILKSYQITIYIYQSDKQGSSNEQRAKITFDCDAVATEFLIKLKDNLRSQDRDFTFEGLNVQAFYRQRDNILSGLQVQFTLEVPDDFEYCP
jgi:hypothetical protein